MHFVFSPFGSAGDVYPMIALALAMRDRGHRVTMIISGYFLELTEQLGLTSIEFGSKQEFQALIERPELWQPTKALSVIFREGVEPNMRGHYDLVRELTEGTTDTVVISNVWGIGARVAHDKLGIPLVSLHLQPSAIWSDIAPPQLPLLCGPRWVKQWMFWAGEKFVLDRDICPSLNRWRRELGLPPVSRITRWWQSPWCVASFFPSWFAPPQADWPANHIQADFPLWDLEPNAELSPELSAFLAQGSAPIAFTPGSANLHGEHFFRTAVQVCQRLKRRGILLTRFADQIPANLENDILHVPFVPFSKLLPQVAALVHHGGIGTMSQAMRAGVPQAIVGLAHDQFDNLERCKRLNIADGFSARRLTADRLTNVLERLLNQPEVQSSCLDVAGKLQHTDGPAQLAQAIETHARAQGIQA